MEAEIATGYDRNGTIESGRQMIRKVYLKLAVRALVFGAAINAAGKALWLDPLKAALSTYFKAKEYHAFILVAVELAVLFACYKLVSVVILWAFDRFWRIRVSVDRLFDVEGSYLESVYINNELEVVGINHISFTDGELRVDSELRWPQLSSAGDVSLTICARTKSLDELCAASSTSLHYVFEDSYIQNPKFNKTGLTKLVLHRERTPSLLRRLFGHPLVETYSGRFASFDNEICGVIQGRRLTGDDARDARAADDQARQRMLAAEVRQILDRGTKLRTQQPGVVVPPSPTSGS